VKNPPFQFDKPTEDGIVDMLRDWRGRPKQAPRKGKKGWGPKGQPTLGGVLTGRVSTSTAAVITEGGDITVPGELEAWQAIRRNSVGPFDEAEGYVVGNFVLISADPYDEAESYSIGDWSSHSGSVYKANTATTGTRNAGHWTLVDTIGIKRANTTVTASAYDGAEWDDVPDDADYLIDRNQATVTLPHQETEVIAEGVLVKWIGGEIVWMSCSAPTEWA
jgi:hypothetical protein